MIFRLLGGGQFFRLERRSFGVRVNELVNENVHNNYHFAIILGISIGRWVGSSLVRVFFGVIFSKFVR